MSRARGVGKLAAIVSAMGLGGTYVLIAGTTGLVVTGLLLPSTKSARGIVTHQQVHDFRESLANQSPGETDAKPATDPAAPPFPPAANTTFPNRLQNHDSSKPGTNSSP
jgi:hypothetical protein